MIFERKWAMPSHETFTIKPIATLLKREIGSGTYWLDPFAGNNSPATITNDIDSHTKADHHYDALEFLKTLESDKFDGVLFDPPYSPRQIKEHYTALGIPLTGDRTRQSFWSQCKKEIARVCKRSGKVISFGWNSNGIGKSNGFLLQRILLVAHGGSKNDTICTVEVKQ